MKTLIEKDKTKTVKLEDSTFAPEGEQGECKNENNTIVKSSSSKFSIIFVEIIRLADFKVTYEIGKGAFSTVFKAERDGKIYALKQINKDKLIY